MNVPRSGPVHMAGGFLLMGSWALFANLAHPMPAPLIAGAVQGTLTAVITLGLKRIIDGLLPYFQGPIALVLPPLLCGALSVVLLATIHSLAGTPEVWVTLALPSTVATLYTATYNFTLRRSS